MQLLMLVLLGSRQPQMLHEQLQRLELVGPVRLDTRLLGKCLQVGVGDGFGASSIRASTAWSYWVCFVATAACTSTFFNSRDPCCGAVLAL